MPLRAIPIGFIVLALQASSGEERTVTTIYHRCTNTRTNAGTPFSAFGCWGSSPNPFSDRGLSGPASVLRILANPDSPRRRPVPSLSSVASGAPRLWGGTAGVSRPCRPPATRHVVLGMLGLLARGEVGGPTSPCHAVRHRKEKRSPFLG